MFALHSDPWHSAGTALQVGLVAIVYANEAYPQSVFETLVSECRSRGLCLAGVLQHPVGSDSAGHCDVALEELTTGTRTDLFENRGPSARGCRLDAAALAEVNAQVARSLDADPELLILNKFGKVEAEGHGLLDLVALAADRGIPVVIGVPLRNLDAWRKFAGELAVELSSDQGTVMDWLNSAFPVAPAKDSVPPTDHERE